MPFLFKGGFPNLQACPLTKFQKRVQGSKVIKSKSGPWVNVAKLIWVVT